jgi:hypothetical protein
LGDEADALCDRILIIDQGRIIGERTPEDLKRRLSGDIVTVEIDGDAGAVRTALAGLPAVRDVQVTRRATAGLGACQRRRAGGPVGAGRRGRFAFGFRVPVAGLLLGLALLVSLAVSLAALSVRLRARAAAAGDAGVRGRRDDGRAPGRSSAAHA